MLCSGTELGLNEICIQVLVTTVAPGLLVLEMQKLVRMSKLTGLNDWILMFLSRQTVRTARVFSVWQERLPHWAKAAQDTGTGLH